MTWSLNVMSNGHCFIINVTVNTGLCYKSVNVVKLYGVYVSYILTLMIPRNYRW